MSSATVAEATLTSLAKQGVNRMIREILVSSTSPAASSASAPIRTARNDAARDTSSSHPRLTSCLADDARGCTGGSRRRRFASAATTCSWAYSWPLRECVVQLTLGGMCAAFSGSASSYSWITCGQHLRRRVCCGRIGELAMKRLGVVAAALLALLGAGSVLASGVHLVVSPVRVAPGGVVRVSAAASPCLVGDQVTLISASFRGHAFGGQGAVYGPVGSHGSFSVRARIRSGLRSGRYAVTGRCGGGNLGVSTFFRVVPRRSSLAVYFVRAEHVAPVRRVVAHTPAVARAALAALLRGPSAAEQHQGYTSAIPGSTSLRSVSLSNGVLTVDLSGRFQAGGGSVSMLLRVAQVVYTATQFPTVDRVAFRVDGKPVEAIGGEGVLVSPPVGRADFEGQAPAILVEQPLPGDHVSLPLLVRGTANVFEAQFTVEVQTTHGILLARRSVHAGAGSGTRGSFTIHLPLTTTAKQLVLVAYDTSAKNGSRIDVVRIPITVG
jgi:hypothetical protein